MNGLSSPHMPRSPNFNQRLKNWRSKAGLSQSQAASALGVPKRTLQDWEQGRRSPRGVALDVLSERIAAERREQRERALK